MSPMPLITLNQLMINDQKLGEGEFGIVYAVSTRCSITVKSQNHGSDRYDV